jgi:hypothetical protein
MMTAGESKKSVGLKKGVVGKNSIAVPIPSLSLRLLWL